MGDEGDLLRRAGSGDERALDELVLLHLPALRAYVRLNVPPDVRALESCSDLVQSVCREVLQVYRFEYRGPAAFRAWLCQWALNKIRDRAKYWRAQKRNAAEQVQLDSSLQHLVELYSSVLSPSTAAIGREHVALLEQAFDRLSDEDRELIALCRIHDLPRVVVAERLGKSVEAVRMQLSRALARLAGVLERMGIEP